MTNDPIAKLAIAGRRTFQGIVALLRFPLCVPHSSFSSTFTSNACIVVVEILRGLQELDTCTASVRAA